MKEYNEFIVDAYEWQANKPRFYIEELLPNSNDTYGIFAGRTGRGKTALLLQLACCFATGTPFFDLQVEAVPVGYLGFEGNKINISERLEKILRQFPQPKAGYLNLEIMDETFTLQGNVDKVAKQARGLKVLLIDRAKGLVYGDYIKPKVACNFVDELRKTMRKLDIATIISLQVRKTHEFVRVKPGDLFEIKGAGDYVEDATFALLLEEPSMKNPPDNWRDLYFVKKREARRPLDPVKLVYDYDKAMFIKR